MNQREQILKDHPLLFPKPIPFDCGDGWLEIIAKCADKLEELIRQFKLEGSDSNMIYAVQVKEKYGGLRFYMSGCTDDMHKVITEAEEECDKTCEVCGKAGHLREHGIWLDTLCDFHHEARAKDALSQWKKLNEDKGS